MDYELKIEQKPGYLHGIVTGQNSREAVAEYLQRGILECNARDCFCVLIESRLQGPRLPLWDIFEIAAVHSQIDIGFFEAIAYVDVAAPAELLAFIENVTSNRGLPLRAFSSVAAAERWLTEGRDSRTGHSTAVE
jgi:hypothetical protein